MTKILKLVFIFCVFSSTLLRWVLAFVHDSDRPFSGRLCPLRVINRLGQRRSFTDFFDKANAGHLRTIPRDTYPDSGEFLKFRVIPRNLPGCHGLLTQAASAASQWVRAESLASETSCLAQSNLKDRCTRKAWKSLRRPAAKATVKNHQWRVPRPNMILYSSFQGKPGFLIVFNFSVSKIAHISV
jgi:hypothetical protein